MTGGDVEEEVVDPVAASSGGAGELFAVISAAWPASGVVDAVLALLAAAEFSVEFSAVGSVEVIGLLALLELSGDVEALDASDASVEVSLDAVGKLPGDDESEIAAVTAITSPAQKSCTRIPTLTGVKNCLPSDGKLSICEFGLVIGTTSSMKIALV
ncbi:MAG: hypothetical protein NT138_05720 [Planctomycetales bacterium]|nr:hypothetical protein [Planctomycetales bacterium]